MFLGMRRFIPALLPFLALAVMGNSCEFRAGVNNSLPPAEGETPREGNGLLVLVRSGDAIQPLETEALGGLQEGVAAALSVSALSSPIFASPEVAPASPMEVLAAEAWVEAPGIPTILPPTGQPTAAVPEPSGLLLFAGGLCLTSLIKRRGRRTLESARVGSSTLDPSASRNI